MLTVCERESVCLFQENWLKDESGLTPPLRLSHLFISTLLTSQRSNLRLKMCQAGRQRGANYSKYVGFVQKREVVRVSC